MLSRTKGGKAFLKVDENNEPVRPALILPGMERAAVIGSGQRLLVFKLAEINALVGGGRGVILQELDLKEKLLGAAAIGAAGLVVEGAGRGGKEFNIALDVKALKPYEGKRARKGKMLAEKIKVAGLAPARSA
jgi:topoisomerase IV subunit A